MSGCQGLGKKENEFLGREVGGIIIKPLDESCGSGIVLYLHCGGGCANLHM